MFRILFSTLFIGLQLSAFAQLQNPSFEQTDTTGRLSAWKLKQGNLTKLSAITFGAIPFTAFEGNYFALLESDTLQPSIKNGILEQIVSFADSPQDRQRPGAKDSASTWASTWEINSSIKS